MKRVVVIAAHPDDELLGVGATLAKHVARGDEVHAIVCSEGATARYDASAKNELQEAGKRAAAVIGMSSIRFLGFADQRLDTVPLLEVTQTIERALSELRPDVLYVHHWGDMNRDHRIVAEAVMVAGNTSISAISKPVIVTSKSRSRLVRCCSSIFRISGSQPAFSASLLSARM